MNIVFAINDTYSTHLGVIIASIIENNKNEKFNFFVLHSFVSTSNQNIIKKFVEERGAKIQFLNIKKEQFENFKLNIKYISLETYFRYLIPELLPNEKKALYLDCDMIVNGGLRPLYDTDLSNYYCAGVRDLWMLKQNYLSTINFSSDDLYINAGMLLLNLEKMRQDDIVTKLFDNTFKYMNKIQYQDQDIINITFKGKIKEIDSIYNFMVTNTQEEPLKKSSFVIRHYNGCVKPWDNINNFESDFYLYFYYKNFSPFYSSVQIFNVYHKDMMIFQSEINSPIQTGNGNFTFKLLNDNSGNNIHERNNNYAELTASYWVWKNYIPAHPNLEYVGFGHYRRFLDFNKCACTDKVFCKSISANDFAREFSEKYTEENIYPIIRKYDIILPETYTIEDKTVYQHFVDNHPVEEINNIMEVIASEYPDMVDDMNDYIYGRVSYFCLNYVMKVSLFNDFMTWAFDILNKLDKKTDWKKYSDYMSEKTPAYLMERFFNVWLRYKQRTENLKVLNVHGVLLDFTEPPKPDVTYKKVKIFPGISLVKKANKRTLKVFGIKISLKKKRKSNEEQRVVKIFPGISLVKDADKRILKIFGISLAAKKKKYKYKSVLHIGKIKITVSKKYYKKLTSIFKERFFSKRKIKLVATLLVKNEVDILEQNIKFHLSQGVDFIVATDNGSTDGSREILQKYQKLGVLELIDEKDQNYNQVAWVDRMIKIAKKRYHADWVINLDADEFWYSEKGNIKQDLMLLKEFNVVYVPSLFMTPNESGAFYNSTNGEYKKLVKCIHKVKNYKKIHMGSHDVDMFNKKYTAYSGISLFHYFARSYNQFEQKIKIAGEALLRNRSLNKGEGLMAIRLYKKYQAGVLKEEYDKITRVNPDKIVCNSKMKDYYNNNMKTPFELFKKNIEE